METSEWENPHIWEEILNLWIHFFKLLSTEMAKVDHHLNNNNNNNNRFQRCNSRFLQSPLCAANCLQHVCLSGLGAIVCKSHATHWALITCNMSSFVPHGTKRQLSYQVWQSLNHIYFSFILLAEPLNWWRRGGNRSNWRKPLATSFTKCHILKPKDKSPKWDLNQHLALVAG